MESQTIARLLAIGRAGWANVPRTGSIPGVTIPAGSGSILVLRGGGCVIVTANGKPITRPERIAFPRAIRLDRVLFRQHVSTFENNIQYMYLDIKGNVTVGLGHLLRDANEAKQLLFLNRATTTPAHAVHIENAYFKVLNSGLMGSKHTVFKNLTHIDLDLAAIDTLFNDDVDQFVKELKARFPEFETYSGWAQLGMLDLAYNMGTGRFFGLFKKFRAALELRNWIKVADESKREEIDKKGNPISSVVARNNVVRGWFLKAIKDEPFFLNPDCSPKQLSTIPG